MGDILTKTEFFFFLTSSVVRIFRLVVKICFDLLKFLPAPLKVTIKVTTLFLGLELTIFFGINTTA